MVCLPWYRFAYYRVSEIAHPRFSGMAFDEVSISAPVKQKPTDFSLVGERATANLVGGAQTVRRCA